MISYSSCFNNSSQCNRNKYADRVLINNFISGDINNFIVKFIDDDTGFIFTDDLTGFSSTDHRSLPGQEVSIVCRKDGKIRSGNFVPTMPAHLLEDGDEDNHPCYGRDDNGDVIVLIMMKIMTKNK